MSDEEMASMMMDGGIEGWGARATSKSNPIAGKSGKINTYTLSIHIRYSLSLSVSVYSYTSYMFYNVTICLKIIMLITMHHEHSKR
jgi:hypothetical protein